MKITKFVHSCLLVEMPAPVNRTVLFDPGSMSQAALDIGQLEFLDDIIITHQHSDHYHLPLIRELVAKFPSVRITAPSEVKQQLELEGIQATDQPSEGISFFDSPHEIIKPLLPADPPQEVGVHYLQMLTDPGDSHSFHETMPILALPMQAPWGTPVEATRLALELKPQHIIPIHDWHWSDEARAWYYDTAQKVFAEQGITFHSMETGKPIVIEL